MAKINTPSVIAGFDTETSGLSAEDQIITSTIVEVNQKGDLLNQFDWLLQPVVSDFGTSVEVHGVSYEFAQENGKNHRLGIKEILEVISDIQSRGNYLGGHNLAFDFTRLYVDAARYDLRLPNLTHIVDTYVLDKYAYQFRPGGHKLIKAAAFHDVVLSEDDAHAADADAIASAKIAFELYSKASRFIYYIEAAHTAAAQYSMSAEVPASIRGVATKIENLLHPLTEVPSDRGLTDILYKASQEFRPLYRTYGGKKNLPESALVLQDKVEAARSVVLLNQTLRLAGEDLISAHQDIYRKAQINLQSYLRKSKSDDSIVLNTAWPYSTTGTN